MLETRDGCGLELSAKYFRVFRLRMVFLLPAIAVYASLSLAQQSLDPTTGTRPSQADCAMAASSGRSVPGCGATDEAGGTGGATRQQQQQLQETAPILPPQLFGARPESAEQATVPPVNPSDRKRVEAPQRPHTEFEQIVADTIGRTLPLFGQSLFLQPPSTFAPTDRAQVPGDYVVGPDDELQIRVWGQINADLRAVVDRSGQIYVPRVGQISVIGVHYSDLARHLKAEIGRTFHNFDLSVSIGRIRSIQIYVVGQARYPGTYTISSLSSLVNAIFASGGPSEQGSLRDVQVQRDGKTVTHFDIYDLLVKGDKSSDVRLQSGDVLYFPPVGPLVAVAGSVNTPSIYEIKRGSTVSEAIDIAGGLSTVADSNKVTIERIGDRQFRSVLEFPLDSQSRSLQLNDGDILRVLSVVPRFSNAVTLRGNVVNPGRYAWKPGMRVRDLIPDSQALLTRSYWLQRANMTDGRSTEYPIRAMRSVNTDNSTSAKGTTSSPTTAATGAPQADTDAQGRDIPGQFGRKNSNSETLTEDLHRASPEINWSYAIIQRVNPVDLSVRLISFDLGKAVLEGDPANNLELQSDDIITVFSQADVSVPQSMRARYIRLEGEVVRAGVYKVEQGELIRDVLRRAGGLTPNAYIYGTQFTRESARAEQQKSIDELARTLEGEILQAQIAAGASGASGPPQTIVTQVRNARATGRVVLSLRPTSNSLDAYPAIAVEDNDRIVIPHLPSTVSVVGMVYNPGSFVFDPHRKAGDYLRIAGKGKAHADLRHAFVLRADGSVVARKAVNGLFSGDKFEALRMYPGDQIVVPTKIPTGAFVRGLRDWTQISSQLAITGAELAVIH